MVEHDTSNIWIQVRLLDKNYARIVQLVRTLISCIKNENSIFSPGLKVANGILFIIINQTI
jgi:hypothetical protein